jgi:hypothetical protein
METKIQKYERRILKLRIALKLIGRKRIPLSIDRRIEAKKALIIDGAIKTGNFNLGTFARVLDPDIATSSMVRMCRRLNREKLGIEGTSK